MSENLEKFEHIVVLMLENRSFDHMLGYLTRDEGRTDIDGLTGDEVNEFAGVPYKPKHLCTTRFGEDPKHDYDSVQDQLADNNGGFVRNFRANFPKVEDPGIIMGYHDKNDVPVYHYLSNEYLICDRWFCSMPGPTSPNRAYSLSGTTFGQVTNPGPPALPPYYAMPTIFDCLDAAKKEWRCYSHDVAWLRTYRQYFTDITHIQKISAFFAAARKGQLKPVSWIEPNYEAAGIPWFANDDHPTSDIRRGQKLVLKIYKALLESPQWEKVLFVITYDEHGGFYDHVVPPEAPDDWPQLRQYGVRVPAIVVSPYVKRGSVSSVLFDHTAILKTILLKFCGDSNGETPNWLSKRVREANHLGVLLAEDKPRLKPKTELPHALAAKGIETNGLMALESEVATWNLEAEPAPKSIEQTDLQETMRLLAEAANNAGVPTEKL